MNYNLSLPSSPEDDFSDSLSTEPNSSNLGSSGGSSFFLQLSDVCDMDAISDQSKKISKKRNKRNAYDKVDDEKRLQLLNSVVHQGETLKQAAKRLGINYSTAKSILHTFRKEGRILKKSPLEKPLPMSSIPPSKEVRLNHMKLIPKIIPAKVQRPLYSEPLNPPEFQKKVVISQSSATNQGSPMREITSMFENFTTSEPKVQKAPYSIFMPKNNVKIPLQETSINHQPVNILSFQKPVINYAPALPTQSDLDNFYMNYSNSPLSGGRRDMLAECSESGSRRYDLREFDSFGEMINALQRQSSQNEEFKVETQIPKFMRFNSEQSNQDLSEPRLSREESLDLLGFGSNTGIDGQAPATDVKWLLRDAMKKASLLNNLAQYQKT